MTTWNVKIENTEKYIEKTTEWYNQKGWKVPNNWYGYFQFNIDILIDIIEAYKKNGINLRALLEFFNNSDFTNLGKEIFKLSLTGSVKSLNRLREMTGKTEIYKVTETFYESLGKTIVRAYNIAEKYSVVSACRNDDRYRYFCKYKLYDRTYLFEEIVVKRWYKETMIPEALFNRSSSNVCYMLANFEEYLRLDYDMYTDLKNYSIGSKIGLHYLTCVNLAYFRALFECLGIRSIREPIINFEMLAMPFLLKIKEDMNKFSSLLRTLNDMYNAVENTEYASEFSHELHRVKMNLLEIATTYRSIERLYNMRKGYSFRCASRLNMFDSKIRERRRIFI